jgi:cell division transport system permease protein
MMVWLTRHLQTLIGSLGRLAEQPVANVLTAIVIGIALALPATLYALATNAREISADWARAIDISMYLRMGTTAQAASSVTERIRQRRDVGEITLIAADDALAQFRDASGFGAALDALTENPLPHTIVVRPSEAFATVPHAQRIAHDLRQLPEVEVVQLDTEWASRLQAMLDAIERGVILAGLMLGLGVMIIVGNTIRLDIQNRSDEIEVSKLVGGSDAFVRRPFLYSGFWYGLAGGVIAWIIVTGVMLVLAGPVGRIAGLYGSAFALSGLDLRTSLTLIAASISLAWLGSFLASTHHLQKIEPA